MNNDFKNRLDKIYYRKGSAAYLSGLDKLHNESGISRNEIEKYLAKQNTYQIHALKGRKPIEFPKIIASDPWKLGQIDLAFFNKNSQIFLILTDVFSGYTLAEFMGTRKTGKASLNALKRILKKIPGNHRIESLASDAGSEFSRFSSILKPLKIKHVILKSFQKAAAVENRIGQIRSLYRKYSTLSGKKDTKSIMPYIIRTINRRYSRVMKMSPIEALKRENQGHVFRNRYQKYLDRVSMQFDLSKIAKYQVGQKVRVINYRTMSEMNTALKRPLSRFSSSVFTVYKVNQDQFPITYLICDSDNILISKSFPEKFLIATFDD